MASPAGSETTMALGGVGDTAARDKAAAEKADMKYLMEMRGGLMTVATLFIALAFDAALHPPEWFKTEWYTEGPKWSGWPHWKHAGVAAAPSPHAAAAATATRGERLKAGLYLACNAVTFGTALAVVLFLLWTPNSASAKPALLLLTLLSFTVTFTFAMATANSWAVTWVVFLAAVMYAYPFGFVGPIVRLWRKTFAPSETS